MSVEPTSGGLKIYMMRPNWPRLANLVQKFNTEAVLRFVDVFTLRKHAYSNI